MINFATGIVVPGQGRGAIGGNINMNPKDIRKAYLKTWFTLDILATFPFDIICQKLTGAYVGMCRKYISMTMIKSHNFKKNFV